jgi:3D (Asp-Asp-Asp) domain-containing protein
MYKSSSAGYPIRDQNGKVIGPKLSLKDYCNMGLQGSGAVDGVFYTYSKSSPRWAAPCKYGTVLYSKAPAGSVGQGVYINGKKQELIPFKSIAVDPNEVPYGTKVFIPAAKGLKMPNGTIHDGVFHAQDTGGAIKNDDLHFDFFTGAIAGGLDVAIKLNPFPFVRSSKAHRFDAFIVE